MLYLYHVDYAFYVYKYVVPIYKMYYALSSLHEYNVLYILYVESTSM